MKDYVSIQTWDPEREKVCYHWVHKSEKDPVQFVKNLNPSEELFETTICRVSR